MISVSEILRKKHWTGEELGQLELLNLARTYKQIFYGNPSPKPILDAEQFQKMVNSISDPSQEHIYSGYVSIYEWLSIKQGTADAQYQQAQFRLEMLRSYLSQAFLIEDIYWYIDKLPVVMTQKQYDDIKKKHTKEYLYDENHGNCKMCNVFEMINKAIVYYLGELQQNQQKPNPLAGIKQKYANQPVCSKIITSNWDKVTEDIELTLKRNVLDNFSNNIACHGVVAMTNVLRSGGTMEEANAAKEKSETEFLNKMSEKLQSKICSKSIEDVAKWDIVEHGLLQKFYPTSFDVENSYTDSSFLISMRDFSAEFKELVDVILADMDEKFFRNNKVSMRELPLEKWGTTKISLKELYKMNFYGEQENGTCDSQIFEKNKSALLNGVAILRPKNQFNVNCQIDKNEYYEEPKIDSTCFQQSLESFTPECKNYESNIKRVQQAKKCLLDSYYYIIGFNTQLDIIANFTGVHELKILKKDSEKIAFEMRVFNDLVEVLGKKIRCMSYESSKKSKKISVLDTVFSRLDFENIHIPSNNIAEAKKLLNEFAAFDKKRQMFDLLMCIRPQNEQVQK